MVYGIPRYPTSSSRSWAWRKTTGPSRVAMLSIGALLQIALLALLLLLYIIQLLASRILRDRGEATHKNS